MSQRFVIAMMRHETNTFSPTPTGYDKFSRAGSEPPLGGQALELFRGTNSPFAAFVDIAEAEGAEIVVPIAANAWPAGKVTDDAFERISGAICEAVRQGCDAVMLDLHGAMVTESHDDGEGELLRRVREIAPEMPIAVALDFHTNLSRVMIDNATVIAVYRTYPHIDMYETGERAGRTLVRALKGEVKPVIHWGKLPMLTHMLRQTPSQQPMKDIMDRAIAAEASGEVLNASVIGGFPLADIPHASLSTIVVTDENQDAGDKLTDELLRMAWERREDFVFPIEPMAESLEKATKLEGGPVILVDHGDNCGAGGNADVMDSLKAVIEAGLTNVAAGPFWDPSTVAQAIEAGVGADITVDLCGKTDMPALELKGKPLRLQVRVRRITDGLFTVTGPMMTGLKVSLGRTVVLDTGNVEIVVGEKPFEPFDTGCFTHAGIDPAAKDYVLIKSRQHFRAGFEPIAKHIVLLAGPGVCSSDYSIFPFKNLTRPIYPLEPDTPPGRNFSA